MGMTIEIKVDNTKAVIEQTQAHKERALLKCGAACESYAKQGAPVDTGRLRNSIKHELESSDTVAIGTDVEYSVYVHEGHWSGDTRVLGWPFLRFALTQHLAEYENIIANEFNNG